jgi:hypothetical protein
MPKEINQNPIEVNRETAARQQQQAAVRPAGKNLRALHQFDNWPVGHVIGAHEVPGGAANAKRLVSLGAAVETDDPASGPLDTSTLPPGAAVTHQLVPGDELPPNAMESVDPARDAAIAEANAKSAAAQAGGDAADRRQAEVDAVNARNTKGK